MCSHNLLPDHELAILLKDGDESAFLALYDRYKFRIAGNLMRLLKSEELTEEVLQELFIKIWDNHSKIDPEKSFRSYLFRVSENLVFDIYRRAAIDKRIKVQLMTAQTEAYTHIEENLIAKENHHLLMSAINLLPPQRRQVFTLCKVEGRCYKEVSELLGISTSTINDHLLKAKQFLKKQLSPTLAIAITFILTR